MIKKGCLCEEGTHSPTLISKLYTLDTKAVGTHDQLLAKKGDYFNLASKTQKAKA